MIKTPPKATENFCYNLPAPNRFLGKSSPPPRGVKATANPPPEVDRRAKSEPPSSRRRKRQTSWTERARDFRYEGRKGYRRALAQATSCDLRAEFLQQERERRKRRRLNHTTPAQPSPTPAPAAPTKDTRKDANDDVVMNVASWTRGGTGN